MGKHIHIFYYLLGVVTGLGIANLIITIKGG